MAGADENDKGATASGRGGRLHGVTLKKIVVELVEELGWEEMGRKVRINCFNDNPSVESSLKFLRKTPWARAEVEELYLRMVGGDE